MPRFTLRDLFWLAFCTAIVLAIDRVPSDYLVYLIVGGFALGFCIERRHAG